MKKEKVLYNLVLGVLIGIVMIFGVSCESKKPVNNITQEEKQEIAEATKPVAELEVQETAKKQWDNAKEFKPEFKEVVYNRTKQEEYKVKIKAKGIEPEAQVDFNKNGFYLSVFKSAKEGEVEDVETFDFIEKWTILNSGSPEFRDNYKIKGDEVYGIEFGEGDFGAAFLVQDEDGVYPVIARYGNVSVGNTDVVVPEVEIIKFLINGNEYLVPTEYLITRMTVVGKDLVITYGDGSKEHWQVTLSANGDGSYYLKRIS